MLCPAASVVWPAVKDWIGGWAQFQTDCVSAMPTMPQQGSGLAPSLLYRRGLLLDTHYSCQDGSSSVSPLLFWKQKCSDFAIQPH